MKNADHLLHVQPLPKISVGRYVLKVMEVLACVALILLKTHVSIGSPLIGRFFGPRKNRLNRNVLLEEFLWYKLLNRGFKTSKVPFFWPEFSIFENVKQLLGLFDTSFFLSQI